MVNILHVKITLALRSVSNDARNYDQFCTMFNSNNKISDTYNLQKYILNIFQLVFHHKFHSLVHVSVSDHQLIYCTRIINKTKIGGVRKHITFHLFKKYNANAYKDALKKVDFPNCELCNDINEAYSNFFHKVRIVVDNIAPCKTKRGKGNT